MAFDKQSLNYILILNSRVHNKEKSKFFLIKSID